MGSLNQQLVFNPPKSRRASPLAVLRIFTGLIVALGALVFGLQFSSPAWAGCTYRGTAPACGDGGSSNCKAGEEWVHAAKSATDADPRAQFGAPCVLGGRKALCCTKSASNGGASGAIGGLGKAIEQGAGGVSETVPPPPCPEGQIRHKGKCEQVGVLPGSKTGQGGGFVQMIPSHAITADVDLYAQCGGEGSPIGQLKKGQTFTDVKCRSDNWCSVGGQGCIWGDFITH